MPDRTVARGQRARIIIDVHNRHINLSLAPAVTKVGRLSEIYQGCKKDPAYRGRSRRLISARPISRSKRNMIVMASHQRQPLPRQVEIVDHTRNRLTTSIIRCIFLRARSRINKTVELYNQDNTISSGAFPPNS